MFASVFRVGAFVGDHSLKNFGLGIPVWGVSLGNCCLLGTGVGFCLARELSLDAFRLEPFAWELSLGQPTLKLSLGNVRVGAFAW